MTSDYQVGVFVCPKHIVLDSQQVIIPNHWKEKFLFFSVSISTDFVLLKIVIMTVSLSNKNEISFHSKMIFKKKKLHL